MPVTLRILGSVETSFQQSQPLTVTILTPLLLKLLNNSIDVFRKHLHMEKMAAVASLGSASPSMDSLLQPARLRAALAANDRLKLYLTVLQAAVAHAHDPQQACLDLKRDIAAADIRVREEANWLHDLPATAALQGHQVHIPDLPRLIQHLSTDLDIMARPLIESPQPPKELAQRVKDWQHHLQQETDSNLDDERLNTLTHGQRHKGDSLHILVMDLHKALNHLAAQLATESVEGAHAWQLAADGRDVPRLSAFMRGLNRTKALKLDHPGLDTAATREGDRLLIQNDIGTNDAHVLVIQINTQSHPQLMTLTYSDLHRQRFTFFQQLLSEVGAQWAEVENRQAAGLNAGDSFFVGTAHFEAKNESQLAQQLEGIGERLVFLIDWNHARKRLNAFVNKTNAVQVLARATQSRTGHMAWLKAGGDRLIWNAMAAQGSAFRLGDRLDDVLGADAATDFLVEVLALAHQATIGQQPSALVADEVRALLARCLHTHHTEFDLLEEHAALCNALAQALRDALSHGCFYEPQAAQRLAARAKSWERAADQLVVQARTRAERQPFWQPMVRLMEHSDDLADALEEACFILSLIADHFGQPLHQTPHQKDKHPTPWDKPVLEALNALAEAVLVATQDQVKALAIARTLGKSSEVNDQDEFLAAAWRVLQAERQCDELLRSTRQALTRACREHNDAIALSLGTELAAGLESATDTLLAFIYALREWAFNRMEQPA